MAFLDSLSDRQRAAATYPFAERERVLWQYTPGPRGGLALADMDPAQRESALSLLDAGLSERGVATAREIMALEPILKAMEEMIDRPGSERRNPLHYWFSVFGDPSAEQPWAWRVGGHHLCVHFTTVGDESSVTPLFFGANPARVPDGERAGLRVLAAEEDLARSLLRSLPDDQRAQAVVSSDAPNDILTTNQIRAEIALVPTGVEYSALDPASRRSFDDLIDHYLSRVRRPAPVEREGLTFAWAGATEVGKGHYYAIRGSFLIEYDNTQNGANHVHTVWRDLRRDWGEDLLRGHYGRSHAN